MHVDSKKTDRESVLNSHASSGWSLVTTPPTDELLSEFSDVMTDGEPNVSAGDSYNIDAYVELVKQIGYDIDYHNLVDEYGFIAQVTINEQNHAVWQGGITEINHSVLLIQQPLEEFDIKS